MSNKGLGPQHQGLTKYNAQTYIEATLCRSAHERLTMAYCQHSWEPWISGYKCKRCGYWSGSNEYLNRLIKADIRAQNRKKLRRSVMRGNRRRK